MRVLMQSTPYLIYKSWLVGCTKIKKVTSDLFHCNQLKSKSICTKTQINKKIKLKKKKTLNANKIQIQINIHKLSLSDRLKNCGN